MDKNSFQQFRRSQIAELRPYVPGPANADDAGIAFGRISISAPDRENGSPKLGDMIARNPANHDDVWLVAKDYFAANFEPLASDNPGSGKVTSTAVSSIGGRYLGFNRKRLDEIMTLPDDQIEAFVDHVQSLAGTAASQAPGQSDGRSRSGPGSNASVYCYPYSFEQIPDDDEHLQFENEGTSRLVNAEDLDDFWAMLDEDEVPERDTATEDFFTRLTAERDELHGRLNKLEIYLGKGAPGTTERHRTMLREQCNLMSDLLAVLDGRIADLKIGERSSPAPEISDAE